MVIKERNINGHIFKISGNPSDKSVFNNIMSGGDYENHIIELYKQILHKDSVCFDIGANIGIISMYMSCFTDAKIYAFEPIKESFGFLNNNTKLNSLNIQAINKAVGDINGELSFYFDSTRCGDAKISKNNTNIKSECTTLDKFVEENNIEKIDCIKMDVEGFETRIFEGAKNTIEKFHPYIVSEYCPKMINENLESIDASEKYFNILKSYYTHIYFVERPQMKLKLVNNHDELVNILNSYSGIGDVFATNKFIGENV